MIEIDAQSQYHNHNEPDKSRINVFSIGDALSIEVATTPLKQGRLRAIFKCKSDARISMKGKIRIEMSRPGMPILFDEKEYEVVQAPKPKASSSKLSLPPFRCVPIDTNDSMWNTLSFPEDVSKVASYAVESNGELIIYYSTIFPQYLDHLSLFEKKDTSLAKSFKERYEIWIAVHSLFLYQHNNSEAELDHDPEIESEKEQWEREERCRNATLAAMFASKEIKSGIAKVNEE